MIDEDIKRQEHHVRLAATVVNTSRWSDLEKKIISSGEKVLSTSRQRKVLFEIFCALRTEYDCIRHDYYENEYTSRSLLAWRARNILEINTWCRFCCEDIANGEAFFKWAGEDQLELEKQLEKWGKATDQPPEWFEKVARIKKSIYDQAEKNGIPDLEAGYKSPSHTAKTFGHDKTFKIHNKILSKFAHPTPMLLLSSETQEGLSKRAFYFFSQGCLFFYDAVCRLEKLLEESQIS